jgi:hypothetical protein
MGCGGQRRPGAYGDRANADGGEFRLMPPEFPRSSFERRAELFLPRRTLLVRGGAQLVKESQEVLVFRAERLKGTRGG